MQRLLLLLLSVACSVSGIRLFPTSTADGTHGVHDSDFPRPDHENAALMARWLAHMTSWGTLATLGTGDASGPVPVGGVVSHSDGAEGCASGRLFFYLTTMDELTQNIVANPAASFTVSEAQLPGGCSEQDTEDPTCARASFLGEMHQVTHNADVKAAEDALFSRHPQMRDWPEGHHWRIYELRVDKIHLLDYYGGMKVIRSKDYYDAQALT